MQRVSSKYFFRLVSDADRISDPNCGTPIFTTSHGPVCGAVESTNLGKEFYSIQGMRSM